MFNVSSQKCAQLNNCCKEKRDSDDNRIKSFVTAIRCNQWSKGMNRPSGSVKLVLL